MIKAVTNTKKYFQPPANYFWRWVDNGEVIEWNNGATICYRDDLIAILKELSVEGFPPLATLLLVLAACRVENELQEKHFLESTMKSFGDDSLSTILSGAIEFLRVISGLPLELKRKNYRIHLIHEIFDKQDFVFFSAPLKESLDELNSGRVDNIVMQEGAAITQEQFVNDIKYLNKAYERYPDSDTLELKLRTGMIGLPPSPNLIIPELVKPDLLGQLEKDNNTAGIARLSKRLMSVLNIPMHSSGIGEQSYGGISDITNRGNYDRLLLSELANDDMSLMARLVNSEALYFRREEPPSSPKRNRTLLIDVTLKMWGIPKMFALAAALAFAHNSKHGETIAAYALGGEKYTDVNLALKEGVVKVIETLHHALHCGKALESIIKNIPVTEQNEYILITETGLMQSPAFHASLQAVRESISFIISVNRNGELQFFECIRGITKLLTRGKLDLDEWLFPPSTLPQKVEKEKYKLPAFLQQPIPPLLHPKVRLKTSNRTFNMNDSGLLVVNQAQIVLLFTEKNKSATEVLNVIEKGDYTFGWDGSEHVYILVNNLPRKFFKFYRIHLYTFGVESINLSDEILFVKEAIFKKDSLFIRTNYASFLFDCNTFTVVEKKEYDGYGDKFKAGTVTSVSTLQEPGLNKYLLPGSYSVMNKVRDIYIGEDEKLVIGNYHLDLSATHNGRIRENTQYRPGIAFSTGSTSQLELLENKKLKFSLRTWKDGSEALIDSRGFLHLRSSDTSLPEVTIILITGIATACWSSAGDTCGSPYFIDEKRSIIIQTSDFDKKYIQPFISRLI